MVTGVRAAAIYARISSDQDGTTLGVQRQLEDCRKLAAELGWEVGMSTWTTTFLPIAASAVRSTSGCWLIWPMAPGMRC